MNRIWKFLNQKPRTKVTFDSEGGFEEKEDPEDPRSDFMIKVNLFLLKVIYVELLMVLSLFTMYLTESFWAPLLLEILK